MNTTQLKTHMPGLNPVMAKSMKNSINAIDAYNWFIHNIKWVEFNDFMIKYYPYMNKI